MMFLNVARLVALNREVSCLFKVWLRQLKYKLSHPDSIMHLKDSLQMVRVHSFLGLCKVWKPAQEVMSYSVKRL